MGIKAFFDHIWDFITQTAKDNLALFEAKITPEIWQAAEQGVIAVFDDKVLHDTAARDAAIQKAKDALTAAGVDISHMLVGDWNALVELVKQSVTPPAS